MEKILNWETRIQKYSDSTKYKYRIVFEKYKELKEIRYNEEGWKVQINDKKSGLVCSTKMSRNNIVIAKSKIISNYDPHTIFKCLGQVDIRVKADKSLETLKNIEKVGVNMYIGYLKMHRIGPVSARDVYVWGWNHIDENGVIWMLYTDKEVDKPDEDGCVRMDVPLGGFVIEPLG